MWDMLHPCAAWSPSDTAPTCKFRPAGCRVTRDNYSRSPEASSPPTEQ